MNESFLALFSDKQVEMLDRREMLILQNDNHIIGFPSTAEIGEDKWIGTSHPGIVLIDKSCNLYRQFIDEPFCQLNPQALLKILPSQIDQIIAFLHDHEGIVELRKSLED